MKKREKKMEKFLKDRIDRSCAMHYVNKRAHELEEARGLSLTYLDDAITRWFMAKDYQEVLDMLTQNRGKFLETLDRQYASKVAKLSRKQIYQIVQGGADYKSVFKQEGESV